MDFFWKGRGNRFIMDRVLGDPAVARGWSLPCLDSYLRARCSMEDSLLLSPLQAKSSCSLPDLIYRVSLDLDAWLISDVALDTVSCKSFPNAAHIAIRHCTRSLTIGQCCHIYIILHRHYTIHIDIVLGAL